MNIIIAKTEKGYSIEAKEKQKQDERQPLENIQAKDGIHRLRRLRQKRK